MACPLDQYTVQGFDMQIGTNVIGHFFLTQCLLPALRAVKTQTGQRARVVTTSSSSHYMVNKFNYELVRDGPTRKKSTPLDVYNVSKFVRCYVPCLMLEPVLTVTEHRATSSSPTSSLVGTATS